MKITIDLSPEEIQEAIIQYVRSKSALSGVSLTTSDVKFQVREGYNSSDPRETSYSARLTGAKVEATAEPRSGSYRDW
jgi:hypothetical protein